MNPLKPEVSCVCVSAHCQQVEVRQPDPGDRPVAQVVHPAVQQGPGATHCCYVLGVLLVKVWGGGGALVGVGGAVQDHLAHGVGAMAWLGVLLIRSLPPGTW